MKGLFLDIANTPPRLKELLSEAKTRLDLAVEIEEYGTGRLTLVVL